MKKLTVYLLILASMSSLFLDCIFASTFTINSSFDSFSEEALPENLRILQHPSENVLPYHLLGLEDLKASGSGQLSEKNFIKLLTLLQIQSDQLIICDLREEIEEYANSLQMYLADELEIKKNEQIGQGEIALSKRIKEQTFLEGCGCVYVKFPMTNGHRPSDELIDRFVQFTHHLSADQWLHFYCQTGKEKTGIILILWDIIKNHRQASLESILERHKLLNKQDLAAFLAQEETLNFLCDFYLYSQQTLDYKISWSEWIQQRMILTRHQLKESEEKKFLNSIKKGKNSKNDCNQKNNELFFLSYQNSINQSYDNEMRINSYFDRVQTLSDMCLREQNKYNRGDKPSGEVEVKYKKTWGGNKSNPGEFALTGKGRDGKGNDIEVGVKQRTDGTGEVVVRGRHEIR